MREIVDKVTCDICGKTKSTPYLYSGTALSYPRVLVRSLDGATLPDDDFFEVRSTQHLCGHCINKVRAVIKQG